MALFFITSSSVEKLHRLQIPYHEWEIQTISLPVFWATLGTFRLLLCAMRENPPASALLPVELELAPWVQLASFFASQFVGLPFCFVSCNVRQPSSLSVSRLTLFFVFPDVLNLVDNEDL